MNISKSPIKEPSTPPQCELVPVLVEKNLENTVAKEENEVGKRFEGDFTRFVVNYWNPPSKSRKCIAAVRFRGHLTVRKIIT